MASVIPMKCKHCGHSFSGFLKEIPIVDKKYFAECTKCKNENIYIGEAEWIDAELPTDYADIYSK